MLNLTREGTMLKLTVEYTITYGHTWTTTFDGSFPNEQHAQLAYAYMRDSIEAAIMKARKDAYRQGWKDKAAKKPKEEWFSSRI